MNGSGELGGASRTMAHIFVSDKEPTEIHTVGRNRKLPQQKNFWYGTTVTRPDQQYAWFEPGTYNWFLSIEPIQEDFTFDASWVIRSETKGTYAPP